jgi:CheY-like chemotaxis protein
MPRPHYQIVPFSQVPFRDITRSRVSHKPVILVVDDQQLIAESLGAILSSKGYSILTAYDGSIALEMATLVPPDLLITDVAMPGMTGVELAVRVVSEFPDCQVILFSGHATLADLEMASTAGYEFPLLRKPIHPAEMLDHVLDKVGSPKAGQQRRLSDQAMGSSMAQD